MSALLDLWHSIIGIVTSGDWITLAIMAVIAIVTGFAMQNFGSIISATVIALVVFAAAIYVRAALLLKSGSAAALAQSDWHNLLGLTLHTLIAYGLLFAIAIGIVHVISQAVRR